VGRLGEGGMGTVYRVRDRLQNIDRALKVASSERYRTEAGLLLFRQEFLAMSSLQHPNLPTALDYGLTDDHEPFLVMELVEGESIRMDQVCDLPHFYNIFVQFLRALSFIHERGFLHRDIKPTNALLTSASSREDLPRLMLLDFGLMERIGSASEKRLAGTPQYMAPEIIKGKPLDPRTDLYSLGICAFQFLTGRVPFAHHEVRELFAMHERSPRPRVASYNHEVPLRLDELVVRMMSPSPAHRPSSAEDVLLELSTLTDLVQKSDLEGRRAYLRLSDLVGRDRQMAQLRTGLSEIESGRCRCLLVAGLTGSGKTRLLQEVHLEALMRGFVVAGVAIREEHRAPYQALRTILRGLVPIGSETAIVPSDTRVLHRLLPADMVTSPVTGDEKAIDPHDERGCIIEESSAWIRRLAVARPILLLADDLQWCDESSLLVLRSLAQQTENGRVMILGATRSDEVLPGSDLDQWLHFESTEIVETPGFSEEEMARFVEGLLGKHALGRDFIHQVRVATDGGPFFVIELLRDLIDRDVLARFAGVWRLLQEQFELPVSLTNLLNRRWTQLSESGQEVALQLAVAGGRLALDVVKAVCGAHERTLLTASEELVRLKLAELRGDDLALVHDSLRELIYSSAEGNQRSQYHQRLAQFLEADLPMDRPDRAALLGHHFARGTDRLKGLSYLESAGFTAFEREEHGVARELLEEAEDLLETLEGVEDRERRLYETKKRLIVVCVSDDYKGGVERGEWLYEYIIRRGALKSLPFLQRFLPDPIPFALILALILPTRTLLYGRRALMDLKRDVNDLFFSTGYMCNCLGSLSRMTTARRRAERLKAFALVRNSLPTAMMVVAQTIPKYHQDGPKIGNLEDFDRALRIASSDPMVRFLDAYTQTLLIGVCYYGKAVVHAWSQSPGFEASHSVGVAFATGRANHFLRHLFSHILIAREAYAGNVFAADEAEATFRADLQRIGGKARQREWMAEFDMGQIDIDCGRFDRAVRRMKRLLRDGPGYFTAGYGALLGARLNFEWGKLDAALEESYKALACAQDPEVGAKLLEFQVLSVITDIYLRQINSSRALSTIDQMASYANSPDHLTKYFEVQVSRRRALAVCLSDPQEALEMARQTLGIAQVVGCPKQLAESHLAMGSILQRCGRPSAEVRPNFSQAIEIYRRLGNRHQEKRVEALMRGIP